LIPYFDVVSWLNNPIKPGEKKTKKAAIAASVSPKLLWRSLENGCNFAV